jgi:IS30 family transposase
MSLVSQETWSQPGGDCRLSRCAQSHNGRKLRRNCSWPGYRPKQARRLAEERRQGGQIRIAPEIWQQVEAKLREDWSPEQVSIWLRDQGEQLSHERIYQHICTDELPRSKLTGSSRALHLAVGLVTLVLA